MSGQCSVKARKFDLKDKVAPEVLYLSAIFFPFFYSIQAITNYDAELIIRSDWSNLYPFWSAFCYCFVLKTAIELKKKGLLLKS